MPYGIHTVDFLIPKPKIQHWKKTLQTKTFLIRVFRVIRGSDKDIPSTLPSFHTSIPSILPHFKHKTRLENCELTHRKNQLKRNNQKIIEELLKKTKP